LLRPKGPGSIIGCFVDEYVMLEFDVEKVVRQQKERARQQPQAEVLLQNPGFSNHPSTQQVQNRILM